MLLAGLTCQLRPCHVVNPQSPEIRKSTALLSARVLSLEDCRWRGPRVQPQSGDGWEPKYVSV